MPHDFTGTARGEVWRQSFTIKQSDGTTPEDITGRAVAFILRTGDTIHADIHNSGGTNGSMQITGAQGQIIVTVTPDGTADINVAAAWALWLDHGTPDADAVTWGKFYVDEVAIPDA
ncbi:hypothetical protein [Streptodolium elevatio]|uniref:Uncharacterized protein n=1 Tax=Streptodolium elevatio TaxID=3157996 RepID=A0ABV3DMZ6_9ACTN